MPKSKDTESSGPTIATGLMEKKLDSSDYDVEQPPVLREPVGRLDEDSEWERPEEYIVEVESDMPRKSKADMLKFNEEPVVIYIHPNLGTNHPEPAVPMWINGKGAEVYDKHSKRWIEIGMLPIGIEVTTRRKYVEQLARSKSENLTTKAYKDASTGNAYNETRRTQSLNNSFQIVYDWNKKEGKPWFDKIMRGRI